MAVLIKTGPITLAHQAGSICAFKERSYGTPVFGKGEPAFIWLDGNGSGGKDSRLYAEGMVTQEPHFEDPEKDGALVRVKVVLTALEPAKPLNYARDIRPHRDDPTHRVMHSLADVICKNANRKVTMIGREEAAFLKSRFDT